VPVSVSVAAKLPYREAVGDHSPGLPGLVFCHKELALKAERGVRMRWSSTWIARSSFSPVPFGRPFRAHFDGAFPGLKAWAILLNRFAVRSIDLLIKIRLKPGLRAIAPPGQGTQTRRMVLATALVADSPYWH
jgi:hypothetical protein